MAYSFWDGNQSRMRRLIFLLIVGAVGVAGCNSDSAESLEGLGGRVASARNEQAGQKPAGQAQAPRKKIDTATSVPRPATKTDKTSRVTLLRVPDGGIQPQVAVDRQGLVHLIYFRGKPAAGDLFYVRSEDGGRGFSKPLRVNSQAASAVATGTVRGAHLAIGSNGRVHVAWNGSRRAEPRGPSKSSPMLYTRMNDKHTGFEPQRNVARFTVGLDGGGSVCADGGGRVYVAWHGLAPGNKGEGNGRVWVARSTDEGKTFDREQSAFARPTGACGCCGMSALADHRGQVHLLYRSAEKRVNRDTYLLVSKNRGATFQGYQLHQWNVAICPLSSFALAESPRGVLAAWETNGQVYFTPIDSAGGERLEPVAAPGPAKLRKHPAIAGNAQGDVILAWTEGMSWNRSGSLAWQVFDPSGKPTAAKGWSGGVPTWSLVAVFPRPEGGFTIVY